MPWMRLIDKIICTWNWT